MKKLLKSLALLLSSFLVFTPLIIPLFLVTIWKYVCNNGKKGIVIYILDIFGGALEAIGFILEGLAIGWDVFFNALAGEGLEKMCSKHPDPKTLLGSGRATASAGLGDLDRNYGIDTKFGKWLDKTLNRFFNEKDHKKYAIDFHDLKQEFISSKEKFKR